MTSNSGGSDSGSRVVPRPSIISIRKNGGDVKTFHLDNEGVDGALGNERESSPPYSRAHLKIKNFESKLKAGVRSTFLPSGYPSRTPPGYLKYCMFSWVQDMSTQLRSVLATQRVLEGVGVGREGATALSALMNYLVRDGCGMAATLLFTSAASSKFRADVKRWRLFADIMVDIGITLEATALLVPRVFFLPMISVGNMCKAMCGVAAGACGGSINLHWATGSDISDINAKFGAQHTVTGALGLIFAALFARSLDHVNSSILWTLYIVLTLAHVAANMQCMRLIAFDSYNTCRMNIVLNEFFNWWKDHKNTNTTLDLPVLSNPEQVAGKEPLFFMAGKNTRPTGGMPIRFGISFNEFWSASDKPASYLEHLLSMDTLKDKYLISSSKYKRGRPRTLLVSMLSNATSIQEAKAYMHASLLGLELQQTESNDMKEEKSGLLDPELPSKNSLEYLWNCFKNASINSGWDLGKTELTTSGYEVQLSM